VKFLFFIISCLIITLPCIPCRDNKDCDEKIEATISKADNPHGQHKHDKESCSPFFTFSCCAVSHFFPVIIKTQVASVIFQQEKYSLYNVAVNAEAHYSIWQPPKLA